MNKRNILTAALIIAASISTGCGKKDIKAESGIVKFVSGDVSIVSGSSRNKIKQGDKVFVSDRIITGADGVAVIEIADGLAIAEIQNNADFKIASLSGNSSELHADQGNIWLNVMKKLVKGESVSLKTKTTVAAVRGTKFYTFEFADYQATCYCEGEVNLKGVQSSYSGEMKQDYLSYTKNGKTIFLAPADTKFLGVTGHNHSMVENSPLGKKACVLTPDMMKTLKTLVDKKFDNAK